ncbi:MAG: hypothetical protein HYS55_01360 [Candidatus Omnitrophica bacterium]|nr:hypothetical protein [Candidatus Omnitrophota bacterium]
MIKNFGFAVLTIAYLFTMPHSVFAEAYDEWAKRGTGALTQLAQGNPQGALHQSAPSYSTQFGSGPSLNAGVSGASLQQNIPIPGRLNSERLGWNGAYNARTGYGLNQSPTFSNDVQLSQHNPLFTSTTTLTPRLKRND